MNEMNDKAKSDLIEFYELYIMDGLTDEVKKMAENIDRPIGSMYPFIEKHVWHAGSPLSFFYLDTGVPCISKEKAIEILKKLKE